MNINSLKIVAHKIRVKKIKSNERLVGYNLEEQY